MLHCQFFSQFPILSQLFQTSTMAAAITTAPPPLPSEPPSNLLKSNNFMCNIDLTTLTQTELSTLSSLLAPSMASCEDLPLPSIDTSVINESAGSRRQTYSRPSSIHHRHRITGSLLPSYHHQPTTAVNPTSAADVTDDSPSTNQLIISSLKQLLSENPRFSDIEFAPPRPQVPAPPLHSIYQQSYVGPFARKKRGRKPKPRPGFEVESEMGLEKVNKNGDEVDVLGLASLENPYGNEISRRTQGMENAEQLLQFLSELGGQWCSRRRKRRFVDADLIGNTLPVGWKLLLGLKRKEGHSWVYVRRYVSPGGKHFESCKEVSEYLQSYFHFSDVNGKMDHGGDSARQQVYKMALENLADVMQEEDRKQVNENETKHALTEDNLKDVQIDDLFECYKCNKTFDEQDSYLEHFSSNHQKSNKKLKVGSSVGEGVIITKDGKFECQFCHKVFDERRRYNGHVGIHVRNYVRGVGELPGIVNLPKRIGEDVPASSSNMDAAVVIPKSSISENFAGDSQNIVSEPTSIHGSDSEVEREDCLNETKPSEELNPQNIELMMTGQGEADINCGSSALNVKMNTEINTAYMSINEENKTVEENNPTLTVGESDKTDIEPKNNSELNEHNLNVDFTGMVENHTPNKISLVDGIEAGVANTDPETMEIDFGFESLNSETTSRVDEDIVKLTSENEIPESSLTETPYKVNEHENVASFEGMGLDEIEFSFGNEQESLYLTEAPVCANNSEMESAFDSSTQFETTEEAMLDVSVGEHQHITECVWCGIEFSHETAGSEEQSDSVGYMCPACKTKISGQFS